MTCVLSVGRDGFLKAVFSKYIYKEILPGHLVRKNVLLFHGCVAPFDRAE